MSEISFLNLAIEDWGRFLLFTGSSVAALWLAVRRVLIGGIFDPFAVIFAFAFGINYGIVGFLLAEGLLDWFLFGVILTYAIIMLCMFRWVSGLADKPAVFRVMSYIGDAWLGGPVFASALVVYGALSLVIFSSIGFGILAETNRFDVARGYGSFIRILDCLSPFIVAYASLTIVNMKRYKVLWFALVALFIFYAAIVNGAKISVIYSFSTALLVMSMSSIKIRISPWQAAVAGAIGLSFSVLALNINLEKNNVSDQNVAPLAMSSNLVTARLIYRFIAFGDTSYLVLPNNVIDSLETDSIAARFAAPLMGNDNLSRMLGYEVQDFSVGRQALLHYTSRLEVAGGPTSHFDLFSYVYFGTIGGAFFVGLLGYILGTINRSVRLARDQWGLERNKFLTSLVATLWSRAVLIIIEPTVALAYILDVFIVFGALSIFWSTTLGLRHMHIFSKRR